VEAFTAACQDALAVASIGKIATFGVTPQRAAMEYGYIRPSEELKPSVFKVDAFIEKQGLSL